MNNFGLEVCHYKVCNDSNDEDDKKYGIFCAQGSYFIWYYDSVLLSSLHDEVHLLDFLFERVNYRFLPHFEAKIGQQE